MLCVIYVDDIKMAGQERAVQQTWRDVVQLGGIRITAPEGSTQFLGCKHHVERSLSGISKITYDMEDFLIECCEKYEALAQGCGHTVVWKKVETPFIDEENRDDRSRNPITEDEDGFQCPYCQGCFREAPLYV